MTLNQPLLSPREFLIEAALYESVRYINIDDGRDFVNFNGTLDSYCPFCHKESIFSRHRSAMKYSLHTAESWLDMGYFSVELKCSRDASHKLYFLFHVSEDTIQKIGQRPSLATLSISDTKKYVNVLDSKYLSELNKAIGLASHGVGVGSFVYLRRIFEFLVEEAHESARATDDWNEDAYQASRMSEKISILKSELPEFLVKNKSIYSILSKGIHSLTEIECLKAFPVIKVGIEIILDAKIVEAEREKKLKEANSAIGQVGSNI